LLLLPLVVATASLEGSADMVHAVLEVEIDHQK
jgi:hypothetical protein